MTAVQISRETLKKLAHESSEIRLRVLDQVDAKLKRAFQHNEEINFKPTELCKQLIRWFGLQPLQESEKVLLLLMQLLQSNYGITVIQQLGAERLQKEMGKVERLLRGIKHDKKEIALVAGLQRLLREYQNCYEHDDELIEITDSLAAISVDSEQDHQPAANIENIYDLTCDNFEVPWSKPTISDFNAIKLLADIFVNVDASVDELQNALQHLQITMIDYPIEYMLQAPHAFLNLLQLLAKAERWESSLHDVLCTVLVFLQNLQKGLSMRQKCSMVKVTKSNSTVIAAKTQLKISVCLYSSLLKLLDILHVYVIDNDSTTLQILSALANICKLYQMQRLHVETACVRKLAKIAEKLSQSRQRNDHCDMLRIKYLLTISLLCLMLENNAAIGCTNANETAKLQHLLLDYPLKVYIPTQYQRLRQLLLNTHSTPTDKHSILLQYEDAFAISVKLLKLPPTKCSRNIPKQSEQIIKAGATICLTLEKLKSLHVVQLLYDSIVDCVALYAQNTNLELKMQATDLLLQLLQLSHEPHRVFIYQQLAQSVKKHFACLMNGESYSNSTSNAKLLAAQVIGVPWNTALMLQLINETHSGAKGKVQQACMDILALLLKSRHLLDTYWPNLLELLIPVLPMLHCCTQTQDLLQLQLKLCDPDAKVLPFITMIRSNVAFLFQHDDQMRSEALTRLLYTLNSLDGAHLYAPNIMEISDLIPNDICYLQVPREYNRIFCTTDVFGDLSTMHNLLCLLESPDIEPLIRKTTFMQLNIMCQNWQLLGAFCDASAYFLVVQALERALQRNSYSDYSDSLIPAIGILSKALFYDAEFRHELADKTNIYILLLRALFLYQHDIQVRQDASLCLFQLIFAHYLIVAGAETIELPALCANLQLPISCSLKPLVQRPELNKQTSCAAIFTAANSDEHTYWRFCVAANIVDASELTELNYKQYMQLHDKYDCAVELKLSAHEWNLMKATNSTYNLNRLLKNILNATDHSALIKALHALQLLFLLYSFHEVLTLPMNLEQDLTHFLTKLLLKPPGNEMDFILYEHLVDLSMQCIHLPLLQFTQDLMKSLATDCAHVYTILLRNPEIPLRLYAKLCHLLTTILRSSITHEIVEEPKSKLFLSNLFEQLLVIAMQYFELRDLQRLRSLLDILLALCPFQVHVPDKLLLCYIKRFINLSLALKSSTQTGAQLQRNCLRAVCKLGAQMNAPHESFLLGSTALKYLSGLCGHSDEQVRALAWCIFADVAQFKGIPLPGADILIKELSYLPGGLLCCCLCTLLDVTEVNIVRQLAGNLFVQLLAKVDIKAEYILKQLEQQRFFVGFQETLNANLILNETLPADYYSQPLPVEICTCEIISSFVRIVIVTLKKHPDLMDSLCEEIFMFKLYEVLKLPAAHANPAYFGMCADICQLYALCYNKNFAFLQRTLCRDDVWLSSYYQLFEQIHADDSAYVNLLQLLLVLCKDAVAHDKLCQEFAKHPHFIVHLYLRAFKVTLVNTSLQRSALATLMFLLIKSQAELNCVHEHANFIDILEKSIDTAQMETVTNVFSDSSEKDKANDCNAQSIKLNSKQVLVREQEKELMNTRTASVLIFIDLFRLFTHLFPTKSYKFEVAPSATKTQIIETLSLLLKFSPQAQMAADNMQLFAKLLKIFQTFFEELKTPCTTYVRRYGETKKNAIIKNLQLLFSVILNWYSAIDTAMLTDELQTLEFSKVLIQAWPWLNHSCELKLLILRICSFLSERSLIVCRQFSMLVPSYANSILQLILKIVLQETSKVKPSSFDNHSIIVAGLRAIMNCCASAEGRVALVKSHVLDFFDGMQQMQTKSGKIKLDVLHAWLAFWELYSRYNEGAPVRNLSALCSLIKSSKPSCYTRLLALKILRNMCFLDVNRSTLLASEDFIYTINGVIAQQIDKQSEHSYEEQLHASVAIWKLISAGIKYIAMIRSTNLAKKLRILREHLALLQETDAHKFNQIPSAQRLTDVLDTIFRIFNS